MVSPLTHRVLFNSYFYLFLFLPVAFGGYFLLNRYLSHRTSRLFLLVASIAFYAWWNVVHLVRLIGLSLLFNFYIGKVLSGELEAKFLQRFSRSSILFFGIACNVASLVYFKYFDFFIENINVLFGQSIPLLSIALPLGISFFTFQEIAYLVDCYRGKTHGYSFVNYALFVTFFPQLIAGPIVHHGEIMPQLDDPGRQRPYWQNIAAGLFMISIGLAKKVILADTFAVWASEGFAHATQLSFAGGWVTSLSYTLQLYFDFSGYTDMALGSALLFNITLPYQALNIQDFWRRWHMTLSRFLRDYLYLPLGGNRQGAFRTACNLFAVFVIGGIWHGAGWTYVLWGILHGIASVVHYFFKASGRALPIGLSWLLTFLFVNFAWIFFRAETVGDALAVSRSVVGGNGLGSSLAAFEMAVAGDAYLLFLWLSVGLGLVFFAKNSLWLLERFQSRKYELVFAVLLAILSLYSMNHYSEFIYFQF